jgi:hypothetical protein
MKKRRYLFMGVVTGIFFSLGLLVASAEVFPRAKKFLGADSGSLVNRIGSLSIGSSTPASWLSNNTVAGFRQSCINKHTTSKGGSQGVESCLDVAGGAAFDALFVNQPAYFVGKVVLNNSFLSNDPQGLVVGSDGHSGNSIYIQSLAGSGTRRLCATNKGEVILCGGTPPSDPPPSDPPSQKTYRWHWGYCERDEIIRDSICIEVENPPNTNETFPDEWCTEGPKPNKQDLCPTWEIEGLSSCENGVQTRNIVCRAAAQGYTRDLLTEDKCVSSLRPSQTQSC